MNTKIIAFYLPQFHETAENNAWWGQGFTEWINVKKAKPLYEGHEQPKTPLHRNYYNLLDETVQIWQARLAKQYGIYGFCYYHYWFHGKLLIEKPMERMLDNPAVDIPFCISWANEPWTRTWTGKNREVLMPQEYGDREDWEAHLQYLLPFFRDYRYIKMDRKPVLLLYRANQIKNVEQMAAYWNERLIHLGMGGIYLVETLSGNQTKPCMKQSDAAVRMEPMLTVKKDLPFFLRWKKHMISRWKLWRWGILDVVDYDVTWETILRRNETGEKTCYLGGFPGWDNSPRRHEKGMIVDGASPEKFGRYLQRQLERSEKEKKEFLFLNAWNEWGEGAYLEPDETDGYGYLEAVQRAIQETEKRIMGCDQCGDTGI